MYNGIGLETARGSGTNGHIQRNTAQVRPRMEKVSYKTQEELAMLIREPNQEILEHKRKRKIEMKCMELRDMLEDQAYNEKIIKRQVGAFRLKLTTEDKAEMAPTNEFDRLIVSGTHQIAAANHDRNQRLRQAFAIFSDYVDGSSKIYRGLGSWHNPLRKHQQNSNTQMRDPGTS